MGRNLPERSLQLACVDYLFFGDPNCWWTHIPNGERRDARTGAMLKKMGVRAGAPDFVFCLPDGSFAAIELKAQKGKLSPNQTIVQREIELRKGRYAVARSVGEFMDILKGWGVASRVKT